MLLCLVVLLFLFQATPQPHSDAQLIDRRLHDLERDFKTHMESIGPTPPAVLVERIGVMGQRIERLERWLFGAFMFSFLQLFGVAAYFLKRAFEERRMVTLRDESPDDSRIHRMK